MTPEFHACPALSTVKATNFGDLLGSPQKAREFENLCRSAAKVGINWSGLIGLIVKWAPEIPNVVAVITDIISQITGTAAEPCPLLSAVDPKDKVLAACFNNDHHDLSAASFTHVCQSAAKCGMNWTGLIALIVKWAPDVPQIVEVIGDILAQVENALFPPEPPPSPEPAPAPEPVPPPAPVVG